MMKKTKTLLCALVLGVLAPALVAQDEASQTQFNSASASLQEKLEASLAELSQLRAQLAEEKVPLSKQLAEVEAELAAARDEFQQATRLLDSRTLDLGNLRTEIKSRKDEASYLSGLFLQYLRTFESGVHISELARYEAEIEAAKLAPENANLTKKEVNAAQTAMLETSLERLHEALSGVRFEGKAVDPEGTVNDGTFVLIGPAAIFQPHGQEVAGTAEQRIGSLVPAQINFESEADSALASELISSGAGMFPLDPTLGDAHEVAAANQGTWLDEIEAGGNVMPAIIAMASAALLVAIFKWLGMAFIFKPSKRKLKALYASIGENDQPAAVTHARSIGGPVGRMLTAGAKHLHEPRELIEEVMYEQTLTTRLKLNRMLPFIAICAASAPLLGLLGTVTGIISTFKLITVFGSGDVKVLSGGISEALITTKFGLIVAIPSLLLHAFLSRKARGIIGNMESSAIAFMNHVGHGDTGIVRAAAPPTAEDRSGSVGDDLVKERVSEILNQLLVPIANENSGARSSTAVSQTVSD